jgi:hypothetical protein
MGLSHQAGRDAALRLWLRAPASLTADYTDRPIKPKLLQLVAGQQCLQPFVTDELDIRRPAPTQRRDEHRYAIEFLGAKKITEIGEGDFAGYWVWRKSNFAR